MRHGFFFIHPPSILFKRYPVQPARRTQKPRNAFGTASLVLFMVLLVAPALALYRLAEFWNWQFTLGYLGVIWLGTYMLYKSDKRRAEAGGWRTPESTLHFVELAGGWPAAYIAQRRIRHKISKPSYQVTFWGIVLSHQFVAVDFLQHWWMSASIFQWVSGQG